MSYPGQSLAEVRFYRDAIGVFYSPNRLGDKVKSNASIKKKKMNNIQYQNVKSRRTQNGSKLESKSQEEGQTYWLQKPLTVYFGYYLSFS